MIKLKPLLTLASILLITALAIPALATTTTSINNAQAVWQDKDVKFWYSGYSTYYDCNALENKLEALLLEFGAQQGAKVRANGAGCATSQVSRVISVQANFSVPVAVDANKVTNNTEQAVFPVSIQEVHVKANKPRVIDRGDCEVIDTFVRELLPNFEHRVVKAGGNCIKGQSNFHQVKIKASVLKAAPALDPSEDAKRVTAL